MFHNFRSKNYNRIEDLEILTVHRSHDLNRFRRLTLG